MTANEDVKYLLAKEAITITKLADELTIATGKKYNVHTLSQKLRNNTLRYDEFKTIAEVLGYRIELVRIEK